MFSQKDILEVSHQAFLSMPTFVSQQRQVGKVLLVYDGIIYNNKFSKGTICCFFYFYVTNFLKLEQARIPQIWEFLIIKKYF